MMVDMLYHTIAFPSYTKLRRRPGKTQLNSWTVFNTKEQEEERKSLTFVSSVSTIKWLFFRVILVIEPQLWLLLPQRYNRWSSSSSLTSWSSLSSSRLLFPLATFSTRTFLLWSSCSTTTTTMSEEGTGSDVAVGSWESCWFIVGDDCWK